jgi:hypothetical protein
VKFDFFENLRNIHSRQEAKAQRINSFAPLRLCEKKNFLETE